MNTTSQPSTTNLMTLHRTNGSYSECLPIHEYSTFVYVVIAIISVISVTAFCTNLVIICTIGMTQSLQTPSNILILNLAISDLLGGLFCQPFYCAFKFSEMICDTELLLLTRTMYDAIVWIVSPVSFMIVVAIIADRFLAIQLHLRYQELVTTRRYALALSFIWVLSFIFSLCKAMFYSISLHVVVIIFLTCLIFIALYFLSVIFRVIRRHSLQIQVQQQSVQQSIDMPRYKKSVNTMYYVIGGFVLCNVPIVGAITTHLILGKISLTLIFFYTISETLLMLNGVVNPIIYCWRIQEIRNAARHLLSKICTRG
ncbi:high-affinity lysophosphatidic acid receptor-like [Actinia tenebrosa]|uniref:High-affinity lysophosphatidic acid receptor-like n=1 Tax=Actinia tenebrosa TaxID=6105 RepID=A0A6P8IZL2_ACTTE|nr:high-affinity lysophosphatidic acid receptor-like [Actinia tenebrosa]